MPIGAFRLNTLSAAASSVANSITASGGTVTFIAISNQAYKLHTFQTVGSTNFVVSAVTGTPTVDLLLVGGGGAGAGKASGNNAQGGGGGGGVLTQTGISVTAQTYSITTGAGGTGAATNAAGASGTASTALGYTANGGGGGADSAAGTNGGGSSGTTSSFTATAGTYAFKGGNSFGSATSTLRAGGGGAGAGGAGVNAASAAGGNGGPAFSTTFTGANTSYSPGGGGGANSGTAGISGFGGGGQGGLGVLNTNVAGNNATAALGAGGGGAAGAGGSNAVAGGSGRQGVAYIRYQIPQVTSISYVTSATSTTTTVTCPTVQAGDVAFFFNTAINTTASAPTAVTPTGFSSVANAGTATTLGISNRISYKICTGSEGGTTLTGMSGTSSNNISLVIYRGNIPATFITLTNNSSSANDATPTNQSITLSGTTGPYVAYAFYASSGSITARGSTVTATREITSDSKQYVKTYESTDSSVSFANTTISMADYGTNCLTVGCINIY
jgi:hypothetical protein